MGDGSGTHEHEHGAVSEEMRTEIADIVSTSLSASLSKSLKGLATVDTESIGYRFGKIDAALETIDSKFKKVDELSKQLQQLPCATHTADIKKATDFVDEQRGSSSKLKIAILAALTGTIATCIIQMVLKVVSGGVASGATGSP
ncbi:MAG: hypothetical protein WC455_28960 [Dehalococcoidia bacterium]|jgi:hypothetical protein